MTPASFDGTTGRSRHAGRRTHVLQILRDAPRPVSVRDVATSAGIPPAMARYHLEAFVDAGLAERTTAPRRGPGRPEVVYTGTLPNQTHERAQGFRVLAATLADLLGERGPDGERAAYRVGRDWADRVLLDAPDRDGDVVAPLMAKLDSLWFAPELAGQDAPADGAVPVYEAGQAPPAEPPGAGPSGVGPSGVVPSGVEPSAADADGVQPDGVQPGGAAPDKVVRDGAAATDDFALVVNNCPLGSPGGVVSTSSCHPACHLEAGFIDGLLVRLGSPDHRVAEIVPQHPEAHSCTMRIARQPGAAPHAGRG